ncbi:MAG TPA: AAA family ATPase [Vicinamibacterales bacterium]|nr:AAA family ATPase [Vicinamibacterales bacterium]
MTQFGSNPPGLLPIPVRLPSSGRSALLTYEPYYGLKEKPFSLSVDPRFLYKSQSHAPIFDDLLAGIRRREGLIVLTGDIGTGKTTLCRAVLEELDRKTFSTFVPDPFVSREDLLKMLLIDFGVMSVDDLKSGRLSGASRPDLSYPLYEFLNSLVPLQAFAVLIIDEAQNLSSQLLEEIRILSDLEAPEKLLQVVLVGQLELREKLKLPEMRQVDQRVSVRCNLEALNREAVAGYIAHRLAVAGGGSDRVAFLPQAVELIFQASKGVPRIINLICDRALHRGHLARTAQIDADIVRVAITDLGLADARGPAPPAFPAGARDITPRPSSGEPPASVEDEFEHISFDEHDLLHAAAAISSKLAGTPVAPEKQPEDRKLEDRKLEDRKPELPKPEDRKPEDRKPELRAAVPSADGGRPLRLLVESQGGGWNRESLFPWFRWSGGLRRLAAAFGVLLLAAAAIVGVSYWQSLEDEMTAPIALPPLPPVPGTVLLSRPTSDTVPLTGNQGAAPAIPGTAGSAASATVAAPAAVVAASPGGVRLFAIDVALFNSGSRADRLAGELTAAGFHAYQNDLDLGGRGHLHEVLVGMYPTREAADADAARIREIRGYQDAKVVAKP